MLHVITARGLRMSARDVRKFEMCLAVSFTIQDFTENKTFRKPTFERPLIVHMTAVKQQR